MAAYHRAPSPYRAPSSYSEPPLNTLAQGLPPPTTDGQIAPGRITYTTTTEPDGTTTYRLFMYGFPFNLRFPLWISHSVRRAACITINGLVSGIRWIPIPAQTFPTNAIPANTGVSSASLDRSAAFHRLIMIDNALSPGIPTRFRT